MKSFLFSLLILVFLVGCKESNSNNNMQENQNNKTESSKMSELQTGPDSILVAEIVTNMGKIDIQLFPDKAPKTVENFVGLAKKGYYKGVIFHRVIENFMIQGGDPTGTGRGGESLWGGKFDDEINSSLKFDEPGYLAMANAGPNTNGSQFFITTIPTPWLNGHHTIFGKVIDGMDVVDAISKVPTTPQNNKPLKDVVMEEVKIEKKANSDNNSK